MAKHTKCPICETELTQYEEATIPGTTGLFCDTCDLEFVEFSETNVKGEQRTGLYAFIPLRRFSRKEWRDFIRNDKNIYGESIPDRMPFFAGPEHRKQVEKEREAKLKERKAWVELVS